MSDTKSSSSSSSNGGMKPSLSFVGDTAQNHVFAQLNFCLNKPNHKVARQPPDSKSRDAWKAEAGSFHGGLHLALSKPPLGGNCGEMAFMAYRKVISVAMSSSVTLAVAAVSIGADWGGAGNHCFVLVGSDAGFITAIAAEPKTLAVTTDSLPKSWGVNVYVCDPWIDDGYCGTFNAVTRSTKFVTAWESYLERVVKQAADKVITRALNTAGGSLTLTVDDCVVISQSTTTVEAARLTTAGGKKTG
ncbi:MAG TPA: hypothetical protein VGG99_02360 [Acetobacteraceae bacterium]|jgi:hypothetical protein